MRYFLSRGHPPVRSMLLVESGSRALLEHALVPLRKTWGDEIAIDLVTCYSGFPEGLRQESTRIYSVNQYRDREARRTLLRELLQNRYALVGIVCSDEPLMTKWKWAMALRLPAKVFIINENGDYFWLDRAHWSNIWRFAISRSGLAGTGAVRMLTRLISFPFTVLYLLLYATTVHTRRALRKS
ncbi:MAG: hypothetical protein LAP40_05935 [Acidobacteriia bacterium]|nr:hypothetical protein [Terriglobia bacterium]